MAEDEQSRDVLKRRVKELESQVGRDHEPRITRNERWRLKAQGALQIIALILGAGGLTYLLSSLI